MIADGSIHPFTNLGADFEVLRCEPAPYAFALQVCIESLSKCFILG